MGTHANDTLWASIEHELFLDDNRDFTYDDGCGKEPHPMFDSGCQDVETLDQEITTLQQKLTILSSSNPAFGKKYRRTWEMRLGMAKQVFKGRPLSTKQKNWIETNWKHGSTDFELFFSTSKHRIKVISVIERILALL